MEGFCEASFFSDAIFDKFPLGKLTPCFENIIALGLFHVFVVVFTVKQVAVLSRMRRLCSIAPTPHSGAAGYVQVGAGSLQRGDVGIGKTRVKGAGLKREPIEIVQLVAAIGCAVAPLLQLVGRAAEMFRSPYADTYDFVTFELVSLPLEALAWATMVFLLLRHSDTRRQLSVRTVPKTLAATILGKEANWIVAFLSFWAFAVHAVKLQFVLRLAYYRWSDAPSDMDSPAFFASMLVYGAQWMCMALLAVGGQCLAPKVRFRFAEDEDEDDAGSHKPNVAAGAALRAQGDDDTDDDGGGGSDAADTFVHMSGDSEAQGIYQRSSLVSKLFFSWMSPLLKLGYQRPLVVDDVWPLDGRDTAEHLFSKFDQAWDNEKKRAQQKAGGGSSNNNESENSNPSLTRALWNCFGWQMLGGGGYKTLNDAAQFVGPIFLKELINFVSDDDKPVSTGLFYASCIFVGQVVGALGEGQYFQTVMRCGMNMRSALVAAVFRKSVVLSHSARQNQSTGKILNLMTSDCNQLQNFMGQAWTLWSSPLRIVVSLVLLYQELGVAALIGASLLVVMIPIQKAIMKRYHKLMKLFSEKTDDRVKLVNEALGNMNVVKCYAWEGSHRERVEDVRGEELSVLRRVVYLRAGNFFLINASPVFVTVLTFAMFGVLSDEGITASKAFTSLSLFSVLRGPLVFLPAIITALAQCKVSVDRLQSFLLEDETTLSEFGPKDDGEDPDLALSVQGSFSWEALSAAAPEAAADVGQRDTDALLDNDALDNVHSRDTLSNVSLRVRKGELLAVVGATGSGKSTLLSAVLGDVPVSLRGEQKMEARVDVRGSVAYVPQQSWIFSGTVRENVLFGSPFDRERYDAAVALSCLDADLRALRGGDLTEIGERGVNLSGGQKQRVSIARAAYNSADIYLLDDPLSALDAHVGAEVFSNIRTRLEGKARVLVTNQLQFASQCDRVAMLVNGRVVEQGTYDECMAANGEFARLMRDQGELARRRGSSGGGAEDKQAADHRDGDGEEEKKNEEQAAAEEGEAEDSKPVKAKRKDQFVQQIQKEERVTGQVAGSTVRNYIDMMGGMPVAGTVLGLFVLVEVCRVGSSVWLGVWSRESEDSEVATTTMMMASGVSGRSLAFYLGIYGAISGLQIIFTLFSQFGLVLSGLQASKSSHEGMFGCMLRAPMSFFQSIPLGRIMNRFSNDQKDLDTNLPSSLASFLRIFIQVGGTIGVIAYSTPDTIATFVPVLCGFFFVQRWFQTTARELKRLDSITRSPVYAHFGQCLSGMSSIRAYRAHHRVALDNSARLDSTSKINFAMFSSNRWLAVRLEALGGGMVFFSALFVVLSRGVITNDVAGLSLSYALGITGLLQGCVRVASWAENAFNAVERINYYTQVDSEAPLESDNPPSKAWPQRGEIEFKNLSMRYRPNLPLVLKDVSFRVAPTQKIGIVGRTGAGKSSTLVSLFRLVEPAGGRIIIDGRDIGELGLHELREKISLIPQDPVLFTGTVRFNLDPFEQYGDEEIWQALERSHLHDFVKAHPDGLMMEVQENGENFSVGQRQLLCLGRALLRKCRVLVLDEATASVDVETDALIQNTIRRECADYTMLIIAHRLNTVIDCDRVLVLSAGNVVEYAHPHQLLQNPDGVLSGMVDATGRATASHLREAAAQAAAAKKNN